MGLAHSPKIVTDGLAFIYDTGSGKSYKGEPTTNLQSSGSAGVHASSSGNAVSVTDASAEKGPGWKKVTITARGTNFRTLQFTYTSMAANTMYCHSAVFDWGNMKDKGYLIYFDGNGTGTRAYYRPGDYVNTGSGSINSTMPDGKFAGTITHTSSHSHAFFIRNYSTGVSGLNDYFYYKEYQVEINTHPTQFTTGTRSATAGLLDLTNTATIDISNVSFDSNAQMTFDGTNDYASLGNPTAFRDLAEGAIETVYYRDASSGTYQMVFTDAGSDLEITYLGNTLQFYIGNSGLSYTHAVTDQWFNVVGTWTSGFKKLYINGVEVASGTNTGTDTGNRDRYVGGRGANFPFNGKIPIARIYDRALTADEILQNYNAFKSRFL
jgi:hypothetical protein